MRNQLVWLLLGAAVGAAEASRQSWAPPAFFNRFQVCLWLCVCGAVVLEDECALNAGYVPLIVAWETRVDPLTTYYHIYIRMERH